MSLEGADVKLTMPNGEAVGYVLNAEAPEAIQVTAETPSVPMNISSATPTQAGGVYDVRDTAGDKAITHLDWLNGAGQKTLDAEDSVWSRFFSSSYVDVSVSGRLTLARPTGTTHLMNVSGPMYAALGYLWCGMADGTLRYTSNPRGSWSIATINASPSISAPITSFVTDGERLWFGVSGGANTGIWSNSVATPTVFSKFGSNPTTAAVQKLAYNNGILFAATGSSAGKVDSTTGAYTAETPAWLSQGNITVALVSAGNAVYWVTERGFASFIYKIYFDGSNYYTEQFAEFPIGFKATCAITSMGDIFVGGYWESSVSGVGQGSVYLCSEGSGMQLLFRLGDRPEDTRVPSSQDNDNRIVASCIGDKNAYFLTTNSCYRWDLDDGGYSHMLDHPGSGVIARVVTESYDDVLPTGGTITTSGAYTIHKFTSSGTLTVPVHRDKYGNLVSTIPAEVLIVAGGGGGDSGGGGGGGVIQTTMDISGAMTVTIGNGGAAGASGSDSTFGGQTAEGGGAGGGYGEAGSIGGSGGGGGAGTQAWAGGDGTSNQGFAGGDSAYTAGGYRPAGGGGGAGGTGQDATDVSA